MPAGPRASALARCHTTRPVPRKLSSACSLTHSKRINAPRGDGRLVVMNIPLGDRSRHSPSRGSSIVGSR
jgi:hypothetical protein